MLSTSEALPRQRGSAAPAGLERLGTPSRITGISHCCDRNTIVFFFLSQSWLLHSSGPLRAAWSASSSSQGRVSAGGSRCCPALAAAPPWQRDRCCCSSLVWLKSSLLARFWLLVFVQEGFSVRETLRGGRHHPFQFQNTPGRFSSGVTGLQPGGAVSSWHTKYCKAPTRAALPRASTRLVIL